MIGNREKKQKCLSRSRHGKSLAGLERFAWNRFRSWVPVLGTSLLFPIFRLKSKFWAKKMKLMQRCPRVNRGSALRFTIIFTWREFWSVPYCPMEKWSSREERQRKSQHLMVVFGTGVQRDKRWMVGGTETGKRAWWWSSGWRASRNEKGIQKPGNPALEEWGMKMYRHWL